MAIANYFLNYHKLVLTQILSGKTGLYNHQKDALIAIYQKARSGRLSPPHREAAFILAGVGTGKTLIQAIAPFLLAPWMQGSTALFLSDNCTLRSRFLRDFPTNKQGCPLYDQWLLYKLNILLPGIPPPKIVELDAANFNSYAFTLHEADMLVGNRQFVVNMVQRGDIEPNTIGALIVDEAHFSAAPSYQAIAHYFSNALLTYFTGSKFRSDSQPLPYVNYQEVLEWDALGNTIVRYAPETDYQFTVQDAWKLDPPPIKRLTIYEAHSEAFLVEEDGVEVAYDPETFFAKAEADKPWFRQLILANSFSLPVLKKAVQILRDKRQHTKQPHCLIVRALNIPHVHRVKKLLEENFPLLDGRVGMVHSERDNYDLTGRPSEILQKFYDGEIWALVHCGMIGVGFDHKWASVSCCLGIFKTLSPAEQEWGRIIRKVPGEPPGRLVSLEHPNWGVVVTHSCLSIYGLFEKFILGVESDTIKELPSTPKLPTTVTAEYEAGETVLTLSNASILKPGDTLQLSVPVEPRAVVSPRFNLLEELGQSSEKLAVREASGSYDIDEDLEATTTTLQPPSLTETNKTPQLPWQAEADAISTHLSLVKGLRTVNVEVEEVLDSSTVQISPLWLDLPAGVEVKRSPAVRPLPDVNFHSHVNLDWLVLVDNQLVSIQDYKKRNLLASKGLSLDENGEITASGVPLRQTMPEAVYEIFLKGLETELEKIEVELPHATTAVARLDKEKMAVQEEYGTSIKRLIHQQILQQRRLVPDGVDGDSLVRHPVQLLQEAISRVEAKGRNAYFKSNQQFLHAAVFGHIKETTGRQFAEHNLSQFDEALQLARIYLAELSEQLRWR